MKTILSLLLLVSSPSFGQTKGDYVSEKWVVEARTSSQDGRQEAPLFRKVSTHPGLEACEELQREALADVELPPELGVKVILLDITSERSEALRKLFTKKRYQALLEGYYRGLPGKSETTAKAELRLEVLWLDPASGTSRLMAAPECRIVTAEELALKLSQLRN